jgi:hypothetical protein
VSENIATPNDKFEAYAKGFAAKILAGKISPAELQGCSIKHMNEPRKAYGEVEEWVKVSLAENLNLGKKGNEGKMDEVV